MVVWGKVDLLPSRRRVTSLTILQKWTVVLLCLPRKPSSGIRRGVAEAMEAVHVGT